jgi:hypothetical protein
MSQPDDLYRRWLDDEEEARRLDERRTAARKSCDEALAAHEGGDSGTKARALSEIDRLEQATERSLACYMGHAANNNEFLRRAFGPDRARELATRLSQRKLSLLTELDRVRDVRANLKRKSPDREGPGSS